MSVSLKIDVSAVGILLRSNKRFRDRLQDPSTWEDEVHAIFLEMEQELFRTEGASGGHGKGKKWAKLLTRKPPPPILNVSGRLRRSLTRDGVEHVWKITRGNQPNIEFGTRVPYAGYHQGGTRFMVARPPLDLTADQLNRISKAMLAAITRRSARGRASVSGRG